MYIYIYTYIHIHIYIYIYIIVVSNYTCMHGGLWAPRHAQAASGRRIGRGCEPRRLAARPVSLLRSSLLTSKIAWLELSGRIPMGLGIPPHKIKVLLESNPLKSRILVRRLAVIEAALPASCRARCAGRRGPARAPCTSASPTRHKATATHHMSLSMRPYAQCVYLVVYLS